MDDDKQVLAIMKAECPCCTTTLIGTMFSEVVDRFQVEYDLQLQRFSEDVKLETRIPYFSPLYRRAICPNCGRIVVGKIELNAHKSAYTLTLTEETDRKILDLAFKQGALKRKYWESSEDWKKG